MNNPEDDSKEEVKKVTWHYSHILVWQRKENLEALESSIGLLIQ